jgi:small conductance mechanosensitive channel
MDQVNLQQVGKLYETLSAFAVSYGFQILGALVFLLVGLKLASWSANKMVALCATKSVDPALARFIGSLTKIVFVGFVVVITLGNFGISIAPLIALAGASAFGATIAIQGPLSNYGAGVSILLGRSFKVGDTITVGKAHKVSGVVEDVTLAMTLLVGEDGERITIPNKEIVGEVIVNSADRRIVEVRIALTDMEDTKRAIATLRSVLQGQDAVAQAPPPVIGVHDFMYGGVILGLRFWVPSRRYYEVRYAVNTALTTALRSAGVSLAPAVPLAVAAPLLSGEADVTKN